MTTLHIPAHRSNVAVPGWVGPAVLGVLVAVVLLLLQAFGVAAPDLTLPISPFVVPGGPDLYATTA